MPQPIEHDNKLFTKLYTFSFGNLSNISCSFFYNLYVLYVSSFLVSELEYITTFDDIGCDSMRV